MGGGPLTASETARASGAERWGQQAVYAWSEASAARYAAAMAARCCSKNGVLTFFRTSSQIGERMRVEAIDRMRLLIGLRYLDALPELDTPP